MNTINQRTRFLFLSVFLATSPVFPADDSDIRSQLKACATKADQSDRLACYDGITRSLATAAQATATAAVPAQSAAASEGSPTAPKTPEPDDTDKGIAVKSVSCQRGHSNEYVFTLDNGEIWRQVGGNQVRLASCEFAAHIQKDFFGYKMIVDDENAKFRVKRVN